MVGLAAPAVAGAAGAGASAGISAGMMTLLVTSLAATAAGTAMSALGARQSADAQKSAADYNASVERNNATAAGQQSIFDAQQISDKTRRDVAMQRAAMASSGFDANSGTFSDVTFDTKKSGELNRLSRIYQGQLGINRSISQAGLDTAQGQAADTAGWFSVGSTILGGVNQATTIASNPSFRN